MAFPAAERHQHIFQRSCSARLTLIEKIAALVIGLIGAIAAGRAVDIACPLHRWALSDQALF